MQDDRTRATQLELAAGLQTLYGSTVDEEVPEALTGLLAVLGGVEAAGAMGGRTPAAMLTPGGQSSTGNNAVAA